MSGRGLILGIESSCDETAAAIVEHGARTLSSVVASQIATHARYGGVVPELASREHLRAIVPVVRAALAQANLTLADLDAIAVTSGPGLAGALLVGITYAKALAFAQGLPLIAVNHLEGHIHAVLLNESEERESTQSCHPERAQRVEGPALPGAPSFPRLHAERVGNHDPEAIPDPEPALALVVSGGHTHLYLAQPAHGAWSYSLVGRTLDDAAGEAFDKVAKLLGFGYPGGPWIDALARFGNPLAVPFSFAQFKPKAHLAGKAPPRTKAARTAPIADLDPRFLFSFSGIKTAVLRYVELHNLRPEAQARAARLFPALIRRSSGAEALADSNDLIRGLKPPPPSEMGVSAACLVPEAGAPDLASETWETTKASLPSTHSQQRKGAPSFPLSSVERVGDHEPQPSPGAPGLAFETWESAKPNPLKPPTTKEEALALCPQPVLDLIASFQHAVVGDLLKKTFAAAESLGARRILITGGVAANRELRQRFTAEAARRGLNVGHPERSAAESKDLRFAVSFPTLALSTDNAAMIAAAAWPRLQAGNFAPPELSADPSLALGR
jgi:N6-L-threonylcarbamoyladenine synthase